MSEAVLAWSSSDLDNVRPSQAIVVLTAEALMAARTRHINHMNLEQLLQSEVPIETTGLRLLNDLHAELRILGDFWLEAYANVVFGVQVYQFVIWLKLLRALRTQLGDGASIRLPSDFLTRRLADDTFIYGLAQESLLIACKVVEREGLKFPGLETVGKSTGRRLFRRLVARGSAPILPLMCRAWSNVARIDESPLAAIGSTDVLLVTQQYLDGVHAIPLAKRLKRKYGSAFRWVGMLPQKHSDLTLEESSLLNGESLEELNFMDSREIGAAATANSRQTTILDAGSAWRVAGILTRRNDILVRRQDWFELLSGAQYRGITSRASLWQHVLENAQPKVIVGLSALQDMALIRGWARRRAVPFVSFMHGAFPGLWRSHDVDADYLGVFGQLLADCPLDPSFARPRRIVPCGPMQFADKAKHGLDAANQAQLERKDVLFLGSFEALPFAPVTLAEQWQLVSDAHRACIEVGRTLRLRAHPRYPIAWSPYVDELARRHPGTISISREPSISRDLATCVCAITIHFDGAMMDAMLANTPVLTYLPSTHPISERHRILESAGGLVTSFGELKMMLSADQRGDIWANLQMAQKRFVQRYFDSSQVDPWALAVDLVHEALLVAES